MAKKEVVDKVMKKLMDIEPNCSDDYEAKARNLFYMRALDLFQGYLGARLLFPGENDLKKIQSSLRHDLPSLPTPEKDAQEIVDLVRNFVGIEEERDAIIAAIFEKCCTEVCRIFHSRLMRISVLEPRRVYGVDCMSQEIE